MLLTSFYLVVFSCPCSGVMYRSYIIIPFSLESWSSSAKLAVQKRLLMASVFVSLSCTLPSCKKLTSFSLTDPISRCIFYIYTWNSIWSPCLRSRLLSYRMVSPLLLSHRIRYRDRLYTQSGSKYERGQPSQGRGGFQLWNIVEWSGILARLYVVVDPLNFPVAFSPSRHRYANYPASLRLTCSSLSDLLHSTR
jgi:hypothetical protein